MFTMGGDFVYESSLVDFKNMDKLIEYINDLVSISITRFYCILKFSQIELMISHSYVLPKHLQKKFEKFGSRGYCGCCSFREA